MRRWWLSLATGAGMLAALGALPAGATTPAERRAIIRTVQQYQAAATSSPVSWARYCGLLADEPRQSLARWFPILADRAPASCVDGGPALQAAWPYRLVRPKLRARDRRQGQRDIAAGKVSVFGDGTASLAVRWHGSGCIPGTTGNWELQRVGQRWLIRHDAIPGWPCLSRPATAAQAQALRSLFTVQINALDKQDAERFCQTGNMFDLRLGAAFSGWDPTGGFDCAAYVRSVIIGSERMGDLPRYRELVARARWSTVAYGAVGRVNGQYLELWAYYLGGNRWKASGHFVPGARQCCEILD